MDDTPRDRPEINVERASPRTNTLSEAPRSPRSPENRKEDDSRVEEDKDKDEDPVPSPPKETQSPRGAEPQQEQAKFAGTTGYYNPNKMVQLQRSNLLTMHDRHQLEQEHMKQLESGAGPFGTLKINLDAEKVRVCNIKKDKPMPQENHLISLLQDDGLFVDSHLIFKNKDINVQKLEERLLNCGQSEYFKIDGQIKLNNDILANELTRPADLAFEQTDAF